MIPHIYTLFEFISIPYENQHQTLNIKKIDRAKIKFREYSITLLQPSQACCQWLGGICLFYWGALGENGGGGGLQQQQGAGRRVRGRRNIFRVPTHTPPPIAVWAATHHGTHKQRFSQPNDQRSLHSYFIYHNNCLNQVNNNNGYYVSLNMKVSLNSVQRLKRRKWKCLGQGDARAAILVFYRAEQLKLGRGRWDLASCHVLFCSEDEEEK